MKYYCPKSSTSTQLKVRPSLLKKALLPSVALVAGILGSYAKAMDQDKEFNEMINGYIKKAEVQSSPAVAQGHASNAPSVPLAQMVDNAADAATRRTICDYTTPKPNPPVAEVFVMPEPTKILPPAQFAQIPQPQTPLRPKTDELNETEGS